MAYTLTYELINNNTSYKVTGYTGEPVDVVIPKEYNALPVTSIDSTAFFSCSSLTSVVIGDSVTSIGEYAFNECSSLTSIVIPDSVTSIGYRAFEYCSSLTSIVIGDSVTSIDSYAFYGCSSLTSVYITDIEAWCNISFKDFFANPLSNGASLYLNNELVTDLQIPNTITKIKEYTFSCSSLTSVVIGDSVTSIGESAFEGCSSLTKVTLLAKTPATLAGSVFTNISTEAKFYCLSSAIDSYKTATNWNTYADKFVADDMRIYFTMNSMAQKKYFASKEWVQAQGYDAAPAVYSPIETEAGNAFTFDDSMVKIGHLYKVIIQNGSLITDTDYLGGRIGGNGDIFITVIPGDVTNLNSAIVPIYAARVRAGTYQWEFLPNANMSLTYSDTMATGQPKLTVLLESGDASYTIKVNPSSIKLVEVR